LLSDPEPKISYRDALAGASNALAIGRQKPHHSQHPRPSILCASSIVIIRVIGSIAEALKPQRF
jgi:hypothetical protein